MECKLQYNEEIMWLQIDKPFFLLIMVNIYIMACGHCDNGNERFDRKSNNQIKLLNQIKIMLNYKRYNKKTMLGESVNG